MSPLRTLGRAAMNAYLDAADRRVLREQLEARARALRDALAATFHEDGAPFALPNHLQETRDEGVADAQTELDVAGAARGAAELEAVEDALQRIGLPAFGTCVECGHRIARERLLAQPTALRCLACERRAEAR